MTLRRWEPFGLDWPEKWRRWFDFDIEPQGWLRVEEFRDDDTCVIRAELPGVDPDKDVDVSVSEGILHISAKREEEAEHAEALGRRSEFRYGEFSRDLTLPKGVHKEQVKASYKDGILEVRVPWPKDEEPSPSTKVAIIKS